MSKTIEMKPAPTKEEMKLQFKVAIETKVTPYYDLFNRCTQAIIKEIDSDKTTIDAKQARTMVNILDAYGTLIHDVLANPQLQSSIIDFIAQIDELDHSSKSSTKESKL